MQSWELEQRPVLVEKHSFDYFASTSTGLEGLLEQELKALGAVNTRAQRGGIAFEAKDGMVPLKAILKSRLASRVFKALYSFEAHSEKSMYQDLAALDWKNLLDVNQTFRLTTIFGKLPRERGVFTNSQFTTLKAKDAIVDWFNHHQGKRPSIDKENPDVSYLLKVDDAGEGLYKVQFMLDLCGEPLSNRGYRQFKTEAPVRENLAAGILLLLNWDPKVEGLVDGMCGSGTFLIEGALIAGDISPQFLKLTEWERGRKPWAFLESPWFQKDQNLVAEFDKFARETMQKDRQGHQGLLKNGPVIVGNDNDAKVVMAARENLRMAGLAEMVPLTQKNAEDVLPHGEKCLFICNPPYGERLMPEQEEDLKALYHGVGENWKKNWKGHRAGVLTGNLPMLKVISLRTSQKIPLFNGDIECRIAEYKLY